MNFPSIDGDRDRDDPYTWVREMNSKKVWGHPDRWLIRKVRSGWNARAWYITAAGTYEPGWVFRTGAEALAAFAKGEQQ